MALTPLDIVHLGVEAFVLQWMEKNFNPLVDKTTVEQRLPLQQQMCRIVLPESPEHYSKLIKESTVLICELANYQFTAGTSEHTQLLLSMLETLEEARQETIVHIRMVSAQYFKNTQNKKQGGALFVMFGDHRDPTHPSNWLIV